MLDAILLLDLKLNSEITSVSFLNSTLSSRKITRKAGAAKTQSSRLEGEPIHLPENKHILV